MVTVPPVIVIITTYLPVPTPRFRRLVPIPQGGHFILAQGPSWAAVPVIRINKYNSPLFPARGPIAPKFRRYVPVLERRHVFPARGPFAPRFRRVVSLPEGRYDLVGVPMTVIVHSPVVAVVPTTVV